MIGPEGPGVLQHAPTRRIRPCGQHPSSSSRWIRPEGRDSSATGFPVAQRVPPRPAMGRGVRRAAMAHLSQHLTTWLPPGSHVSSFICTSAFRHAACQQRCGCPLGDGFRPFLQCLLGPRSHPVAPTAVRYAAADGAPPPPSASRLPQLSQDPFQTPGVTRHTMLHHCVRAAFTPPKTVKRWGYDMASVCLWSAAGIEP